MPSVHQTLAAFYDRVEPLGVAFVGPPAMATSFGRPPEAVTSLWERTEGFLQYHIQERDISVYVSSFGRGKFLIAQFPFQDDYPPLWRPWLAFVRLASEVTRILEKPDQAEDSGLAGVLVRKPNPASPRSRAAEAALGDPGARP